MTQAQRFNISRRGALIELGAGAAILATTGRSRGESKLQKMSVFTGTTPQFGNLYVAHEKGFFERERLPLELTVFASGSVASEAFQAGRGNAIVCGDTPALRLWNRSAGVGICTAASYGHYSIVVARKSMDTPVDFRGKRIGVLLGSTAEYFAKLYLASGHVDLKEVDIINLQPAEMVTGITRGDIDGFVLWEPFGTRAVEASKDVHIVTNGEKYFLEWLITTTTPDYLQTREAELVAYVRALDAASQWCNANREESVQIVAKYLKLDTGLVKPIERINWTVAYTPKFRADMERLGDFLKLKIDWPKMFDTRILKKVDPSLAA
jgi:ABC-type nitrate/sulfonate/bicarbonate transport system substrate-binding protein